MKETQHILAVEDEPAVAQILADLQTAQLSVQSAAYVFQALKDSSLLNVLR